MEIKSVTYYGWRDNLQTVEKRVTYDYSNGNDVTVVEHRSYLVHVYSADGVIEKNNNKGTNIDQLV